MIARKIMFATDFSTNSLAALDYASSLASADEATLYIVHVDDVTPGLVFGDIGYGYVPEVDEITREEHRELLKVVPGNSTVKYEHHLLRGGAAEELLRFAENEQIDLIVIGTHGRTGLSRMLMGSVAEEVVRRATCPVLTIKQPATTPEQSAVN